MWSGHPKPTQTDGGHIFSNVFYLLVGAAALANKIKRHVRLLSKRALECLSDIGEAKRSLTEPSQNPQASQ